MKKTLIDFAPTEKEKLIKYRINLPQSIEKPGTKTTRIIALELPPGTKAGDTSIGARVGVVSKLFVLVPFPGKYAEANLNIKSAQVNETTTFILEVFNYGTEDIEKAKATIEILDPEGNLVDTVETNERSIKSKGTKKLNANWIGDKIGVYNAKATLNYDGEQLVTESEFYVGNLYIELLDVRVTSFQLGDIAKFEFDVENQWNSLVKNVFAEVIMKSESGEELDSFRSTSRDLDPFKKETIEAFWDTTEIEAGNYLATIAIAYGDGQRTEREFTAIITLDNIILTPIDGATGRVITSGSNKTIIVAILVGAVILTNIIWFVYFKRKIKRKKEGPKI